MFGKGKKEKDVVKMLDGLSAEEKQDLFELLKGTQEVKADNTSNENPTSETSTTNEEKAVEVAKTTDDTSPDVAQVQPVEEQEQQQEAQEMEAIPISEVLTKGEAQKYFEAFEARLKSLEDKNASLEKENSELKQNNEELKRNNEELKEKYENNSFGNYTQRDVNTNTNDNKKGETAKDYFGRFFK